MGFFELAVTFIVTLLVVGPERMPGAVRMASLQWYRLRHSLQAFKRDAERAIGVEDMKQTLHNEKVLKHCERAEQEPKTVADLERHMSGPLPYNISGVHAQSSDHES